MELLVIKIDSDIGCMNSIIKSIEDWNKNIYIFKKTNTFKGFIRRAQFYITGHII